MSSVNNKSGLGWNLLKSLNRRSSEKNIMQSSRDSTTSLKSYDTDPSRRFRTGTPKMPEAMKKTFQQQRQRRILAAFDKEHKKELEWTGFNEHNGPSSRDLSSDFSDHSNINGAVKNKRLSEQGLPSVVFITTSILLVIASFSRLFFTRWHSYYYGFWSAAFPLLLGLAGIYHRTEYLSKTKNAIYIILGLLTTLVSMATSYLSIKMIYNLTKFTVNLSDLEHIYLSFRFTYLPKTDIGSDDRSVETKVYVTLALDCLVLVVSMVNMYAITASLYCMNNHWDAVYTSTGTCDHRGNPHAFNPLQQISLGQALIFTGSVCYIVRVTGDDTYYSELWTGLMVIIASFVSAFHLKRPDKNIMMVASVLGQVLALCCCAASLTFISQALIEDSDIIYRDKIREYRRWQTYISMLAAILYLLEIIANVTFSAGVIFRAFKRNNRWISEHPKIIVT